jgi:hypothetical protein
METQGHEESPENNFCGLRAVFKPQTLPLHHCPIVINFFQMKNMSPTTFVLTCSRILKIHGVVSQTFSNTTCNIDRSSNQENIFLYALI